MPYWSPLPDRATAGDDDADRVDVRPVHRPRYRLVGAAALSAAFLVLADRDMGPRHEWRLLAPAQSYPVAVGGVLAVAGLVLLVLGRRWSEWWLGVVAGAGASSVTGVVLVVLWDRPDYWESPENPASLALLGLAAAAAGVLPFAAVTTREARREADVGTSQAVQRSLPGPDPSAGPAAVRRGLLVRRAVIGVGGCGAAATVVLISLLAQRHSYTELIPAAAAPWRRAYAVQGALLVAVPLWWALLRLRRFADGLLGGWVAGTAGWWLATVEVVDIFRDNRAVRAGARHDYTVEYGAVWTIGSCLFVLGAVAVAGPLLRGRARARRAVSGAAALDAAAPLTATPPGLDGGAPTPIDRRGGAARLGAICVLLVGGALAAGAAASAVDPEIEWRAEQLRTALSPDGRRLYVTERRSTVSEDFEHEIIGPGRVSVLDTATGAFVGEPVVLGDGVYVVPDGGYVPDRGVEVTTSPDGSHVYVCDLRARGGRVFDDPDLTGPATTLPSGSCPTSPDVPAVLPPLVRAAGRWNVGGGPGGDRLFDLAAEPLTWRTLLVRTDGYEEPASVTPDGATAYSVLQADGFSEPGLVVRTDLTTGEPVALAPLRVPAVEQAALSPDGQRLYLLGGRWDGREPTLDARGWFGVVDLESGRVVDSVRLESDGYGSWIFAASADGSRLVFLETTDNQIDNQIVTVDAADLTFVGEPVPVEWPERILPSSDGSRIYVARANGTVSVVDPARSEIVDTIDLNDR